MKLKAFRIKNFRSIVDTGWQSVSPDNITCLIGQNESGKTSVLEGLCVFHTGHITEDILRSDLSLPEVSCRFSVAKGSLLDLTENGGAEIRELLAETDTLELTRFWLTDFTSSVKISGPVSDYLDSLESAWRLYLDEISTKVSQQNDLMIERQDIADSLVEKRLKLESEIIQLGKNGKARGFLGLGEKNAIDNSGKIEPLKKELERVVKSLEQANRETIACSGLSASVGKWIRLRDELASVDSQLREVEMKLEERHQILTLLLKPDDYDESAWEDVITGYHRLRSDRETIASKYDNQTALCGFLLDGISGDEAKVKTNDLTGKYKSKVTGEALGATYFKYTPVFSMFEDFGSLLPNRIDLDEIISGNSRVEGYKAARNFLTLARLDWSFFMQPSSRILKQTIENLNNKLTRNFHEFWQQSVGGRNKIKIQFELEHYSASHGDKAGKPYLEFWIKDEGERLYPKQRSRGVRWFLSFYLELKASAESGNKPVVLMVDEPGVSLHARAQEDVLKVFEDISDRIQIVYTTHSPHLVDVNKLHRVLAVQRDDVESYKSATRIIDPVLLAAASPDTLSPIHSVMGNPFGSGFSNRKHNIIVTNTGTFYFLTAILNLSGFNGTVNIVPATDIASIPLLCNIMMGWGLGFSVLLFESEEEKNIADSLESTVINGEKGVVITIPGTYGNIEDLFSTLDFKKYILKNREGITVQNSVFLEQSKLPRAFLASRLLSSVVSGEIKAADLDEETTENIRLLKSLLSGYEHRV
jgi:hypothetical protein